VVRLLDEIFSAFDDIARRRGLEKIKTIGDCYMVVGGLPEPRLDHAEEVAAAALEFQQELDRVGKRAGMDLHGRGVVHHLREERRVGPGLGGAQAGGHEDRTELHEVSLD